MPKFSVIIPLFNKAEYVRATLNSVLSQLFTDFELLIVNDCSTDKSLEVVKQFEDKRIKILHHKKNSGLSASRNTGIKNASGEIITFIDADDLWKPDFLSSINQLSIKFPDCDIFGTDYEEKIGNKTAFPQKNLDAIYRENKMLKIPDFFEASLFNPIYCYTCVAFSINVFEKIGLFNTEIDYGEDVDFNIRVNTQFSLAYFCKSCAIYNLGVPNQITGSGIKNKRLLDFKKFDQLALGKPSLKKYLNMKRYYYASQYKNLKDEKMFSKFMAEIDFSQLSVKQTLLLKSPFWLYRIFKRSKAFLLEKGVKVTPY
jgi:glycosyltransferase involved in cell wall biosynthesis